MAKKHEDNSAESKKEVEIDISKANDPVGTEIIKELNNRFEDIKENIKEQIEGSFKDVTISAKPNKEETDKLLVKAKENLILPTPTKQIVDPPKEYKADRRMVKPKTVHPVFSSAPPNKPTRYTKYYKGK